MTQENQDEQTTTTTVAIVGGGIAGLFLANACEQQGISYVLLESGNAIAPQLGASIGLLPYGLRLLDQINVLTEVEKHEYPHRGWEHRDGVTGELLTYLTALSYYRDETGYSVFFLERRQLLEILYENIRNKENILVDRKAVRIDNLDDYAVVHTQDGHNYKCHLVVGADGVHSIVRREIEKNSKPGATDQEYLDTRFSCIYGISNPVEGMAAGKNFSSYREGSSCLLFTGLGGTVYWFVFKDLGCVTPYNPERHLRFSAADQDALIKEVGDCKVTDGVIFNDVFARRRVAVMTPLEEGVVKQWYSKRMVLVGDSAHKMVPHAAMGGNLAIESASCLLNLLLSIRDEAGHDDLEEVSLPALEKVLQEYTNNRQSRAEDIVMFAKNVCRDQLCLNENYRQNVQNLTDADWLARNLTAFSGSEKMRTKATDKPRVKLYSERARRIQGLLQKGEPVQPVALVVERSA